MMKERSAKTIVRDTVAGWCFVLPAFLFLVLFMIYPILHTLTLSFQKYNFVFDKKPLFVGINNFVEILDNPPFRRAIVNTLYFALLYIPLAFVIGFVIGYLFTREFLFSSKVSKIVIFLPMVIPISMSCYMFLFILNPQWGLINSVLSDYLKMPYLARDWMNKPATALHVILTVTIWQRIGFIGLLFMAGIQAIPRSVIEASIIDGANAWKRITAIVLPNLRPTYQLVGILAIITSIKLFGQVVAMTGQQSPASAGGPANSTLTMYVATYQVAFHEFDLGIGSAMGYFISMIIVALFIVNFVVNKVERE